MHAYMLCYSLHGVNVALLQAESGKVAKQLKKATQDLSKLKSVKDSYKLAEIKIKALQIDSDVRELNLAATNVLKLHVHACVYM